MTQTSDSDLTLTRMLPQKTEPNTVAERLFDITMAEYNALKAEQQGWIGRRENYTWAGIAGTGAIFFAALQTSQWELLLAVPALMLILVRKVTKNDRKVVGIRGYIVNHLVPVLRRLTDSKSYFSSDYLSVAPATVPVLGWEEGPRDRGHVVTDLIAFFGPAVVASAWYGGVPHPSSFAAGFGILVGMIVSIAVGVFVVDHHRTVGRTTAGAS